MTCNMKTFKNFKVIYIFLNIRMKFFKIKEIIKKIKFDTI